ncbi:AAA domain-containing protein [Mycoplasma elephantis]|uniref:AAA domain-containing protein n=1 Tax=Mycoplasma elephantis TaxID=114882 RepID=UPI00047FD5E0|nr:AAA domain-containing protein [Mycoplasma elephantis]
MNEILIINCLNNDEEVDLNQQCSIPDLKTTSNDYKKNISLKSIIEPILQRAYNNKKDDCKELLEKTLYTFKNLDLFKIICNQSLSSNTVGQYFEKKKESGKFDILNISISGKYKDNKKIDDTDHNTVTLFFTFKYDRKDKRGFWFQLSRIEFFDLEPFDSISNNLFKEIKFIKQTEKNDSILRILDKLRPILQNKDLNDENIQFDKYLNFLYLFLHDNDRSEKEISKKIFNLDINIFDEKKEIKSGPNLLDEPNYELKLPEWYNLVLISKNELEIKEKINPNIYGPDWDEDDSRKIFIIINEEFNIKNTLHLWQEKINNHKNKKNELTNKNLELTKKIEIQEKENEKLSQKADLELEKKDLYLRSLKEKISINKSKIEELNEFKAPLNAKDVKKNKRKKLIEIENIKKDNKDLQIKINNIQDECQKIKDQLNHKLNQNNEIIEEANRKKQEIEADIEKEEDQINTIEKLSKKQKEWWDFYKKEKYYFYSIELKEDLRKENNNTPKELKLENLSSWSSHYEKDFLYCSLYNHGLYLKMKRYFYAILNAKKGYVRNPYMIKSLIHPGSIKNKKEIDISIENKWKLNQEQINAVKGIISTDDTYYLQGPPGTGKTQTICAVVDYYIKNNNNVLITSSTHEAIINCLERYDETNKNNPNIIIYKKSKNDDNNKYSLDNLYTNFTEKIKNNLFNLTNEKGKELVDKATFQNIMKYLENNIHIQKDEIYFHEWSKIYNEDIINKYIDSQQTIEDTIYNAERYISKISEYEDEDIDINYKISGVNIQKNYWILERPTNKKELLNNWDILLNKEEKEKYQDLIINILEKEKIIFLSENDLYDYLLQKTKQKSKNEIDELAKNYFKNQQENLNNEYQNECKNEFIDYVNSRSLINLLGFTTTANTKITIGEEERDIWFEYPIDITIMDQVSKTCTPEIISRMIISHKFIMCGDYKQLQPISDFEKDKEVLKELYHNQIDIRGLLTMFQMEESNSDEENEKQFSDIVDGLFSNPIFKNKIKQIQTRHSSYGEKIYSFLKIQYRFNKSINDLVNNFYDSVEKLEVGREQKEFEKISFLKNDEKIYLIDTSKIPDSYKRIINEEIKYSETDAFDQTELVTNVPKFDEYKNDKLNRGLLNQYNAIITTKIIENLLEENDAKKLIGKIGIIWLTSKQKSITRHLVLSNKRFKDLKIKVDTIDNFQGREKEIIIVDFVRAKYKLQNKNINIQKKSARNLDFLIEEERINVAASRTKNILFLVGAFEYYLEEKEKFRGKELLIKYINMIKQGLIGSKEIEGEEIYEKNW